MSWKFEENSKLFRNVSQIFGMFKKFPTYPRTTDFQNIREFTSMFQNVPKCSRMFLKVQKCPKIFRNGLKFFENVPEIFLKTFENVSTASRMFQKAPVIGISKCSRHFKFSKMGVLQNVLNKSRIFQNVPECS